MLTCHFSPNPHPHTHHPTRSTYWSEWANPTESLLYILPKKRQGQPRLTERSVAADATAEVDEMGSLDRNRDGNRVSDHFGDIVSSLVGLSMRL